MYAALQVPQDRPECLCAGHELSLHRGRRARALQVDVLDQTVRAGVGEDVPGEDDQRVPPPLRGTGGGLRRDERVAAA